MFIQIERLYQSFACGFATATDPIGMIGMFCMILSMLLSTLNSSVPEFTPHFKIDYGHGENSRGRFRQSKTLNRATKLITAKNEADLQRPKRR
jgi:hypothetical protein